MIGLKARKGFTGGPWGTLAQVEANFDVAISTRIPDWRDAAWRPVIWRVDNMAELVDYIQGM